VGPKSTVAVVLDAGALIAFERADARMRALCREGLRIGARLVVPAGVVGQVVRDPGHQVAVRALLRGRTTEVPPLDRLLAEAAGILCGRSGTSDVIDASVAIIAKRERAIVLTSDPEDLERLAPGIRVERI